MKKEHWKYLSLSLSIISIILLLYSTIAFAIEPSMINVDTHRENNDLSINDILLKDKNKAFISADMNIPPTGVDQYQNEYTNTVFVTYDYWWGQLVGFGGETRHITGYCMGIARRGIPTEPLIMGICDEDSLEHTAIKMVSLQPSYLEEADTVYWIGLDFSDSPVTVYGDYKPMLFCASDDVSTDGNFWMWGISETNPYDGQYDFKLYDYATSSFVNHEANWDGTFLVFTEEASAGDSPVITITTSSWVVASQALGILSLLGGVVSGIKFRWF